MSGPSHTTRVRTENATIRGSAEDDFDFVHLVSGMNHFDSSQKVFLVPFFRLEKVRVSLSMPSLVPDRSSQALFVDVSCQWDFIIPHMANLSGRNGDT